jgi:hypothetical protein
MDVRTMRLRSHLRLLCIVTIAWIIFWAVGLPDYYQQYSNEFMLIFDLIILPPIWFVVSRSIKSAKPGRCLTVSLWWSFYISFPLFIYDLLYAGIYLGHGISFLWSYWYITVYYILPWLLFLPTGWLVDKKRSLTMIGSKTMEPIH